MEEIEQKKLELLNIFIEEMPFDLKIKKVNEIIGNPFYVFDTSLRLLLFSNYETLVNDYIAKIGNFFFIDPDLFTQIVTDEDLKYLENNEILIKKYHNIPKRFMVKRINDGKYTIGYSVIYLENESNLEECKQLLEIGTKALSHEFKINGFSNSVEQAIFSRILDGSLTNINEIETALKKIDYDSKGEKRLVVLKTDNAQHLCYAISDLGVNNKFFIYKGDVLCIGDKDRKLVKANLIELAKATNIQFISGVSGVFDTVSELKNAYLQALEAIEIGQKYSPNDTRYYFGDYRIISLFRKFDHEELKRAVDRKLKKVIKYDLENNTSYFDDLKAYFDSGRSINKTAEKLFVHKNSIYYRLDRIKALFNIDVNNEDEMFLIELSIKILNLLDNFDED